MKNKKKLFILIGVIAVIVFVALFFIYYYHESNILTSDDKKWISENGTKVIDIEVFNDVSVYGMNGEGVAFDFLDYVTNETNLQFNKIPYLKETSTTNNTYKFEIIDGSQNLTSNQLLLFEDNYVTVSKDSTIKINKISDFSNYTIGVLDKEESNINYYLKSAVNVKYNSYKTMENLFKALDENEVNMIIVPNMLSLENTINNDKYYLNYFFTDITKKIVLTLDANQPELSNILKKYFNYWMQ